MIKGQQYHILNHAQNERKLLLGRLVLIYLLLANVMNNFINHNTTTVIFITKYGLMPFTNQCLKRYATCKPAKYEAESSGDSDAKVSHSDWKNL
jgi:hypothetical protein